jgi:hypothetical protein
MDSDLANPLKRWSAGYRLHGNGTFRLYDLVVDNPTQGVLPQHQPTSHGAQATVATLTQGPGGRLPRPAAELLGGYVCAHKFFDTLVWLSGRNNDQVLRHTKRSSWHNLAGNSKVCNVMPRIHSLSSLLHLALDMGSPSKPSRPSQLVPIAGQISLKAQMLSR